MTGGTEDAANEQVGSPGSTHASSSLLALLSQPSDRPAGFPARLPDWDSEGDLCVFALEAVASPAPPPER